MAQPLAERMRPKTLDDYIGQKHLVGEGAVLRKMIDAGRISSFILWGPPGVGKTTLAQIIANRLETPFYTLSAVTSGVKDVRDVIDKARSNRFFSQQSPILFIDEIHRFSKSQQDSLLGAVETGVVTLIGATTENPSFEAPAYTGTRCADEGEAGGTQRNGCHAPLFRRGCPQAVEYPGTGGGSRYGSSCSYY